MANLWRVLALSWLGGVASPLLVDDIQIMDQMQPPAVIAPAAPREVLATDPASSEPSPDAPDASHVPPEA